MALVLNLATVSEPVISLREFFVTYNIGVTQAHQSNSPAERFPETVPVTPTNNLLASKKQCKHNVDKSPYSAAKEGIILKLPISLISKSRKMLPEEKKEAIGPTPTGANA